MEEAERLSDGIGSKFVQREMTDDELMARFRRGDMGAFEEIYERYSRLVFHVCRLLLGDAGLAEEAMQETFLRVARGVGEYRGEGKFKAWVMTLCRNCCLTQAKYKRARQVESAERVGADAAGSRVPIRLWPGEVAETREQVDLVERGLAELPPRQREAVLLYAVDGLGYREVAEVMEIPMNTVKTLIFRARASLTEFLDHKNGERHD